jgi:hypothetical protein
MTFWSKFDHFLLKSAIEKNRRFVIFLTRFLSFLIILVPIRIYRKTGPTKSTVLGPRPPPWDFNENYRNLPFLWILGPSIQPEKASAKSASTPYPPWKVNFIANLLILIVRDPIYQHFLFGMYDAYCLFLSVFWSSTSNWLY